MHVDIQPFFKNINPKTYSRMELQDIHYNKAEYVETVRNRVALGYILFHKLFACSQIPHKHCFFLLIKLQTIIMNLCLFFSSNESMENFLLAGIWQQSQSPNSSLWFSKHCASWKGNSSIRCHYSRRFG